MEVTVEVIKVKDIDAPKARQDVAAATADGKRLFGRAAAAALAAIVAAAASGSGSREKTMKIGTVIVGKPVTEARVRIPRTVETQGKHGAADAHVLPSHLSRSAVPLTTHLAIPLLGTIV